MTALVLLVVAQLSTPTAGVDFSGHAPATLQSVLEGQLPALNDCRPAPQPLPPTTGRRPPAVRSGPYDTAVSLVVDPSGAVATVKVSSPGALSADCVHRTLLRLEFGERPRDSTARNTLVTATLRCTLTACRWTWMPREPE